MATIYIYPNAILRRWRLKITGLSSKGFMMRSISVIFLYGAKPVFCICGGENGGTMTQVNPFIVLGGYTEHVDPSIPG